MQTLKEMSLAATVKFGVSPRGEGDIPMELKEQREESEFKGKITSPQGDLEQQALSDFLGQEKQCQKGRAVEFPEPQEEERSIGKKATLN